MLYKPYVITEVITTNTTAQTKNKYVPWHEKTRAETNTRFVQILTWLHMYSNTNRVFGCTVNDFSMH